MNELRCVFFLINGTIMKERLYKDHLKKVR
jgi:hypothetical protein